MDLTEILISDGATVAGGGVLSMRLHHQSEQSDLLWKRALAIAAVLPSFEPDLFVTDAEVRYEERIGKGAFGQVWRAFVNGSASALKQVRFSVSFSYEAGFSCCYQANAACYLMLQILTCGCTLS
jgi:hypothetical protein